MKIFDTSKEEIENEIKKESKNIIFFTAEYTLEILVIKLNNNDLTIPDYQRNFVWPEDRQSKFIESLLIGLPIPFLFFWEKPKTGELEIVDGVQRLSTLAAFINGDLKLRNLKKLTSLNGCGWDDLVASRKRKFNNKTIRSIILGEDVSETTRRDMFERINTGSLTATDAEVRRGAHDGPFMQLVVSLSKNKKFKQLAPLSKSKEANKTDQDLVTRFFAYSFNLENYKNSPRTFLSDFTKKMNEEFSKEKKIKEDFEKKFNDVLTFVDKNFENGFCKPGKNLTSNAYFEALSIGTFFALQEMGGLSSIPNKTLNTSEWVNQKEFMQIVSADGANTKSKVQNRINYVKNKLIEDLKK